MLTEREDIVEENNGPLDAQEEDSCYHSNDDLDETVQAKDKEEEEVKEKPEEQPEVDWDSDNLQVSPC